MKCEIRKWRLSDAKDLAAALSNRNILKFLREGPPFPYTESDALDYIKAMLSADENDVFAYAVCVDGKAVGSIGAFRQENIHFRTAELGYYLSEEFWGKGIMTEAVRQLCEKIFSETNIIRIFAEPFSHNIGSRRVLEKAGFQLEGILKNFVSKDGKIYDAAMYALTKLPYEIRALADNERERALKLAFDVFSEYEAPEYSAEGVEEFKKCLKDENYLNGIEYFGAFDGEMLTGFVGIRREKSHICFFFVNGEYHRRGIGKALFARVLENYPQKEITVNSSPFGVPFYKAAGFVPTSAEQTVNGIRFTPMIYSPK